MVHLGKLGQVEFLTYVCVSFLPENMWEEFCSPMLMSWNCLVDKTFRKKENLIHVTTRKVSQTSWHGN